MSDEIRATECGFTSAQVILPVMMDEYTKERERQSIIDNKAINLLTILVALITVYLPIIPLENIHNVYERGSKNALIILGMVFVCIIGAIFSTIIGFVKLIGVIRLHEYQRFDLEGVIQDEALCSSQDVTEKAMCQHYYKLIIANDKVNNKKAKLISCCFVLIVISFLSLLCSTIILMFM